MSNKPEKLEERPFGEVMQYLQANGTDRGYLGDRVVVEWLLRNAIYNVMTTTGSESAETVLRQQCRRTGRILLGYGRKYDPVPGWNEPGGIDAFAAKWCGSSETEPVPRMEHAVLMMVDEALDIADDDPPTEELKQRLAEVVARYTNIFMGISLPMQI